MRQVVYPDNSKESGAWCGREIKRSVLCFDAYSMTRYAKLGKNIDIPHQEISTYLLNAARRYVAEKSDHGQRANILCVAEME